MCVLCMKHDQGFDPRLLRVIDQITGEDVTDSLTIGAAFGCLTSDFCTTPDECRKAGGCLESFE